MSIKIEAYTSRQAAHDAADMLPAATVIDTRGKWEADDEDAGIVIVIIEDGPTSGEAVHQARRTILHAAQNLGEQAVYFTQQQVYADLAWTDQGYLEGGV